MLNPLDFNRFIPQKLHFQVQSIVFFEIWLFPSYADRLLSKRRLCRVFCRSQWPHEEEMIDPILLFYLFLLQERLRKPKGFDGDGIRLTPCGQQGKE
jgi:hypothetical protein